MKKITSLVTCLILLVAVSLVCAEEAGESVVLYVGQSKEFPVNTPTRIVVGKPEVADVTSATDSDITLAAKTPGQTTFVVWDNFGQQDFTIKVYVEDMSLIKERIDGLVKELNLPGVYTKAADSEGKVLLLGEVKTPQERERIFTAVGKLKEKTLDLIKVKEEETIIEIDVEVLELDKDATHTLGFSWPGAITLTDVGKNVTGVSGATGTTGLDNVFHVSDFTRSAFTVTLDALVQDGKARVLSRPRLVCQSGKEAELLVGGEKPILTTQNVTGGGQSTQVEYKEFGIKLKIKPVVNAEKRIKLGLGIEVSEVGQADILGKVDEPTAKAYPLTRRNINTELALNDGQTLAIGGLRKQKTEEDVRKTPVLGDMPFLGALFRQKVTKVGNGQGERGDTELFITLTPTIVSPGKDNVDAAKADLKPAPAQVAENPPDPLKNYTNIIKSRIMEKLKYPVSAKEAGFQGTVKLGLLLSYSGEVLDAVINKSSGFKILDDNALSTAKGISPYPPFPPSMEQKQLWIEIPIAYNLD